MRIAAPAATLLFALASCSTTGSDKVSPYQQPNELMSGEIHSRIQQIPYQHREELLENLMWLSQTGEQTIPALLEGLKSDNAKVRSSCCWVLGRLRDRRTVKDLQPLVRDREASVRLEAARSLVLMGDIDQAEYLIAGLDSDRKEVRYMCHEALKTSTGHDFGYDHLNPDQQDLRMAVLRWRQWWGEYSGDNQFALAYAEEHGLGGFAAPAGEVRLDEAPTSEEPAEEHAEEPAGHEEEAVTPEPVFPEQEGTPPSVGGTQQVGEGNGNGSEIETPVEVPAEGEEPPVVEAPVDPVIELPAVEGEHGGEEQPSPESAEGNSGEGHAGEGHQGA
ncbi:MAG TPA: HEAT repeat domain-containing protein [bacterium]|nr:HEAT repeat domain-containing protein [bacterium]